MATADLTTPIVPRASIGLLFATGTIIFVANAGLLVLQLLAGRYLAPFIGSSIETWTSVIGVFLSGIALGNWIGGKVADRYPSTKTLGILLILGGISSLTLMGGYMYLNSTNAHQSLPLFARIPILAVTFCILPATFLSMITPLIIKLAMADVRRAGRVAGLSFALSTLGCLLGNYLTGFWLMADYTLDTISIATASILFLIGLFEIFFGSGRAVAQETELEKRLKLTTGPVSAKIKPARVIETPTEWLNLKGNIQVAYLIVFVCSFCGMSLELTGVRVLAPILGVSLYTWTGIIGVMLAGTAFGNYFGGVLADRGPGAAFKGMSILFFAIFGFAMAHSVGRWIDGLVELKGFTEFHQKMSEQTNHQINVGSILIHSIGAGIGILLAVLGILLSRVRGGNFVNVLLFGGAIGAFLSIPVYGQIHRMFLDVDNGIANQFHKIEEWLSEKSPDVAQLYKLGTGFILGAVLTLLFVGLPSKESKKSTASETLSMCMFLASLGILLVVISVTFFESAAFMQNYSNIVERVLIWTFALFFMPMFLLGTISPQVIRLSVPDVQHAGRTAGSIYAISTLGAIVGTFVTGYFLIGEIGTYRVLMIIALILACLTFLVGRLWRNNVMLFGFSLIVGICVIGMFIIGYKSKVYDRETKYYAIVVKEREMDGRLVRTLTLDHLLHSYVDINDPTWLGYSHEYVQEEFIRLFKDQHPNPNLLIIGGGGYTFPRCVEVTVPDVNIEVVEIDPGVTEIAYEKLGLPRDTKIRSHNMDGRQFVMERAQKGHYHLIVQDAVNDLSIPYHLVTKEYNDGIQALLAPDGVYLLTFIDRLPDGKLWRAAARTMKKTFKHVHLLGSDFRWEWSSRAVYVLYGSNEPLNLSALRKALIKQDKVKMNDGQFLLFGGSAHMMSSWTNQLDDERFEKMLEQGNQLILTDQYAPVDNLMSDLFAETHRK
jgi:spermidine synthase/MFS family permease